jgi:hypothetical protein
MAYRRAVACGRRTSLISTLGLRTLGPRSHGFIVLETAEENNVLQRCPHEEGYFIWRPRRDLNPCYRRESTRADGKSLKLRNMDGYLKRFR